MPIAFGRIDDMRPVFRLHTTYVPPRWPSPAVTATCAHKTRNFSDLATPGPGTPCHPVPGAVLAASAATGS